MPEEINEIVIFHCRRGKEIEVTKTSAKEHGFLKHGKGHVRTLTKTTKETDSLFPECLSCGYGITQKACIPTKQENGETKQDWNCVVKRCLLRLKEA